MPAEAAQQVGAQAQRLAQAHRAERGVGVDGDAVAAAARDELQLAAVAERRAQAPGLEALREVDEHRIAVVGHVDRGASRLGVGEQFGERAGAGAHAVVVEVVGADARDDAHKSARAGHRNRQQPVPTRAPEGAELAQHAAVRGAAEADREDDAIARLRDRLLDREHGERLGAVAKEEVVKVGARLHGVQHGGLHAGGVLRARGDDHERLLRAVRRVLEHAGDRLVDLGVDRLDRACVIVGHAVAVVEVVDRDRRVAEEGPRPRQRVDAAGVEAAIDELGEVFAAGPVRAGEAQRREQLGELSERARRVTRILIDRVGGGRLVGDGDRERRWRLRDGVADRDHLAAATDRGRHLGHRDGAGVEHEHRVERDVVADFGHVVRRAQPHRRDGAAQVRRALLQVAGRQHAAAQEVAQGLRLVGPVGDADRPGLRQLPGHHGGAARGVRLVDQAEVGLKPVQHVDVGAEQRAVGLQQAVEGTAPPGELELGGDLLVRNVALREVVEQGVESPRLHLAHQLGALLQVREHVALGGEAREGGDQVVDAAVQQLPFARRVAERRIQGFEVLLDLLVGDRDIRNADGHGRRDADRREPLPQNALLLDARERVMQVAHVNARAQVLLRERFQAAARRGGHRRALAARGGRGDQFAQRTVEDGGLELVERVAQIGEQAQVRAELGERLELPHGGRGDECGRALEQAGHELSVQAAGALLSTGRLVAGRELGAVPGRVARAIGELAELRGLDDHVRGVHAVVGEGLDGLAAEARAGRRGGGQEGQAAELRDAVVHADAELGVGATERLAVVEQDAAQAHERLVDVGDAGLLGLLVAADAANDVATQAARGDRDAGQADVSEAALDRAEGRASRTHDEHPLVLRDQRAEGVDHRLGRARTGQRLHDDRVAGGDVRDDVLLLGVGVEQQQVGLGRALVGGHRGDRRLALLHCPAGARVAGDRVEHRVGEVAGVGGERRPNLGERRDDEARGDRETVEVRGEAAQAVERRVRLEGAVVVGEGDEGLLVEVQRELAGQLAGERRVQHEAVEQRQLDLAAAATQAQGTQEQRGAEGLAAVAPADHADAERNGVDAAHARELKALVGDALGGDAGGAQGDVVAHEVTEQGRTASDEAREAAGVARAELDATARVVVEVQQRARAAEGREFVAPALPGIARHIHRSHRRVPHAQCARLNAGSRHGSIVVELMIVVSVGTPHAVTLRPHPAFARYSAPPAQRPAAYTAHSWNSSAASSRGSSRPCSPWAWSSPGCSSAASCSSRVAATAPRRRSRISAPAQA